ncbi:hypothetical protein JOS77_28955 [Chromobacterium haemolyticum]|nr:hypothetical protein JOS77_28955 [Chromobacterium haemolyticum]
MSSRLPWFRMYADFLNDPKLISLAFEDQRHFIGVLALKCDGAIDEVVDGDLLDRIMAQRLWIDHAVIRDVKRRLVAAGLIDTDWQPIAWDKRQMKSDSDSTGAERQRRYRESRKSNALRDASVTRLDTDTDTEEEQIQDQAPVVVAAQSGQKSQSRQVTMKTWLAELPEDEDAISAADPIFADAKKTGLPEDFIALCWLEFKHRHTKGGNKAKKYKDWRAAFRNSVRDNWYGFWALSADGECFLTSKGRFAQRFHGAEKVA